MPSFDAPYWCALKGLDGCHTLIYFPSQSEIREEFRKSNRIFEVTETDSCAAKLRTDSRDETSSRALMSRVDPAPVFGVLQRVKMLQYLWQTSSSYKKTTYWLKRIEPPHIYIFSHLADALEGQHRLFFLWLEMLPNLHCEGHKQFQRGWVINGTNVFVVQMLSAGWALCKQPTAVGIMLWGQLWQISAWQKPGGKTTAGIQK